MLTFRIIIVINGLTFLLVLNVIDELVDLIQYFIKQNSITRTIRGLKKKTNLNIPLFRKLNLLQENKIKTVYLI